MKGRLILHNLMCLLLKNSQNTPDAILSYFMLAVCHWKLYSALVDEIIVQKSALFLQVTRFIFVTLRPQ